MPQTLLVRVSTTCTLIKANTVIPSSSNEMTKERSDCASHWTMSWNTFIIFLLTLIATKVDLSSSFSFYDVSNKTPRTFLSRHQSRHISTSHHKTSALTRSSFVATPTNNFDCVSSPPIYLLVTC